MLYASGTSDFKVPRARLLITLLGQSKVANVFITNAIYRYM